MQTLDQHHGFCVAGYSSVSSFLLQLGKCAISVIAYIGVKRVTLDEQYLCQVDLKRSKDDGEKCYNQLSNEERAKFDEETLVNLTDNHKTIIRSQSYDKIGNENSTV